MIYKRNTVDLLVYKYNINDNTKYISCEQLIHTYDMNNNMTNDDSIQ